MAEFLELHPPAEALKQILDYPNIQIPGSDRVQTMNALGRTLSRSIISPESLPSFTRSTVDGYAVRASDTYGSSETLPAYFTLIGESPMGKAPDFIIQLHQTALIHTGGMLPEGADAVIMLENTQISRPGEIEDFKAVAVNENIALVGEDVSAGQVVLPAGVKLRPAEIGGLMALGITEIDVARQPRVGILSSGDEVIQPDENPAPGQVRDINSYSLYALVQQHGGQPIIYGIIPDRFDTLKQRISQALSECDLVVITAGSSASTRDLTSEVINSLGKPGVLVHGVNVRPGKPTILAICDNKPIIGLPGNPVSALVIAGLFIVPIIQFLQGSKDQPHPTLSARLMVNIPSQAGREDWIPVCLIKSGNTYQAEPIFYKSNLIFTLAKADGLAHIPPNATGISAGEMVEVTLL